jgi:Dolichyl-phosphate-mannose-protein mannosyltransferase
MICLGDSKSVRRGTLTAILSLAILLRLIFFVGFVNDYGEETIHLQDVFRVVHGEPLASFDHLHEGEFSHHGIDMADLYKFRVLVTLPPAFIMRTLGVGDFTLALWFLFCSLASVCLVYCLGARVYSHSTGCIAAVILATFPLDVIWSSRICADVVITFFFLACLTLLAGAESDTVVHGSWRFLAAGAVWGVAYLAKITAVVILPLFILLAWRKGGFRKAVELVSGFALVLLLENAFYYVWTGVPFVHWQTARGGVENNALHVFPMELSFSMGPLSYYAYRPVFFYMRALLTGRFDPVLVSAAWGWIGLSGLLLSVRQRRWMIPLSFGYLFVYFEMGLSFVHWDGSSIRLYQVFKEPKYLLMALPLVSLLAAWSIDQILRWKPRFGLGVFVLATLFSILQTARLHSFYAPAMKDLKAAGRYLASCCPNRPVYVAPPATDDYLRLFSGDHLHDIRVLRRGLKLTDGSLMLVSGSRGLHVSKEEVAEYYRRNAPSLGRLTEEIQPSDRKTSAEFSFVAVFPTWKSYPPLTLYRVSNPGVELPGPPRLEISVARVAPKQYEVNGFTAAIGEGNDVAMDLYVNGERVRTGFFFPMRVNLRDPTSTTLTVVARDTYGSTTERHLYIE